MKNYLTAVISALFMMLMMVILPASAAEIQLYDEGNRLKTDEFVEVAERLNEAAENINMNVVAILGSEVRSDTTIESMADSVYDQLYGNKTDGICIYIDLSSAAHPYDYISTSGLGQFYYTNSSESNRVDSMLYAVEKYLYPIGSEDAVGALKEFANQLENYYEIGIPDKYWVYDDVYHEYYHVENGQIITTSGKPYIDTANLVMGGIVGLVIGLCAAAITSASVKSKYKFMYQISPTTYLNKKTVHYTEQSDRFIRERTSRTHVSSSSGGRSGGGSHHSGGHSHGGHGGGGHHR
ncbi:MAG: hypothetical protein IJ644_10560 [Oscillospiraceae bacterium]|nr:hypothetical protein [Oscillospiraceae bacterium]